MSAERAAAGELVGVYGRVYDLVPQAFARRPDPDTPDVPASWRTRTRLVFPDRAHDGALEVSVAGEPYLYLAREGPAVRMGLRADGGRGVARLASVLEPGRAERLEAFLTAAARLGEDAMTRLVETDLGRPGSDRTVLDRELPTGHLVAAALRALVDAGLERGDGGGDAFPVGRVPCLVLAEEPIDPGDAVAARRTTARLVDLWRPVWGLPLPGPAPAGEALDRRLAVAYRRSLRQLAGRRPPLERAALRVEVRELVRWYREAGRVRPRLLAVLAARMKVE